MKHPVKSDRKGCHYYLRMMYKAWIMPGLWRATWTVRRMYKERRRVYAHVTENCLGLKRDKRKKLLPSSPQWHSRLLTFARSVYFFFSVVNKSLIFVPFQIMFVLLHGC